MWWVWSVQEGVECMRGRGVYKRVWGVQMHGVWVWSVFPPSLHPLPPPTGKAIATIILSLSFPGPHTTAAVTVEEEVVEEGRRGWRRGEEGGASHWSRQDIGGGGYSSMVEQFCPILPYQIIHTT